MKEFRNIVPAILTVCNIAVAVIFTWEKTTGAFPEGLDPYQGLIILYYFMSWIITLILIAVIITRIVKNIASRTMELYPILILFLNIGYLIYVCHLFYFSE